MVAEDEHKKGEQGAYLAKQWLESTTFVTIDFTAYEDQRQTTLVRLDGTHKRYDLVGKFVGDNKRPLYVEVKNYDNAGKQSAEYKQFLANAYSITAKLIEEDLDRRIEFMWVTWHPFDQTRWPQLVSVNDIRQSLELHQDALDGRLIDEDIVRTVADRLWLIVLSRRHEELLMTREELLKVQVALQRKGFL